MTPEPKSEPPKRLGVGDEGFFRPALLAQVWFITERSSGVTGLSTFRARRAELSANGEILPKRVSYRVMFDVARVREFRDVTVTDGAGNTETIQQPSSDVSALQDLILAFQTAHADISVGQFKNPVSWEGMNSSGRIILPERAESSTRFGDERDLGLKITKTFPKWGYYVGVFNGASANNFDRNVQKDVALRLEVYPIEGLMIGGMTYDSVGIRHREGTRDRWEADVRYEAGPYLFQGELIEARDVQADGADATKGRGFYAAAGYRIEVAALKGDLQPVVRVGFLDPDTEQNVMPMSDGDDDELYHLDAGANLYLKSHEMKFQAGFQHQHFDDRAAVNQLIVAMQVSY